MTIEQASAVNVVLRDLLARHRAEEESSDDLSPEPPELISAAALLADKAHKALGAGLTGDQVREGLS
jgi:hypothetical protein